ncbi:craniofacial development protein 2-like [Biomphalaria glabrata]|uniref:Craniofacial development protein 2-like n=1 Tax=Biomphalaria glabrata TaxID=6526 RepID=A0A9W2ZF90_BIOGL|nr:craniofacial development protein 2-like [Biomphalaria glabrata]
MDASTASRMQQILRLEKRRDFIFGTWNVTSLNKYQEIVIDEIKKYKVDIACVQETRCKEEVYTKRGYRLVLKCYDNEDMKYGLGFIIKEDIFKYIDIDSDFTDRICSLTLNTDGGIVHIINVYIPHVNTELETKEDFFESLEEKLSKISEDEIIFLLGDFNSHVGDDNLAWFRCLGEHGISCRVTDNGRRLLELCTFHDLCIAHSFFDQTENAQYTFQNKSSSSSYIDFCITRNKHRHFVKMTKANIQLKRSTDHLLVTSNIELLLSNPKGNSQPKALSNPNIYNEYDSEVSYRVSKASVALSEMFKSFQNGTKQLDYNAMITHYNKVVLSELTSNCELYKRSPKHKKFMKDFDKKSKRRIKKACENFCQDIADGQKKTSVKDNADGQKKTSVKDIADGQKKTLVKDNVNGQTKTSVKGNVNGQKKTSVKDIADGQKKTSIKDNLNGQKKPSVKDNVNDQKKTSVKDNVNDQKKT